MDDPIKDKIMYRVTIGMPVYNAAAYVERALLSALNQTFPDIEYILVDDRGTDNSMDIVRRVISEHPRGKDVRIIEQDVNRGAGVARDTMLTNATAPYIYFMDSDDELTEDAIALLYSTMVQSGGAQVVQGDYAAIPMGGCRPGHVDRSAGCNIEKKETEIIQACFALFFVFAWNKLYDLDFLKKEKIGFGGLRRNEDNYFSMQVAWKASRVIYMPRVTYLYYENMSSLSESNRFKRYDATWYSGIKLFLEKILDFCSSMTGEKKLLLEQRILGMFYGNTLFLLESSYLSAKEKRRYFEELDGVLRTYPFLGRYRTFKAQLFWMIFQLPIPLRMALFQWRKLMRELVRKG